MQIHRLWYGVRGYGRVYRYAVKLCRMVTEKAKHKYSVLIFWRKHGLAATIDAYHVSRRTLYFWSSQLRKGNNQEALNEASKKPIRVRQRVWPQKIKDEIRVQREEHPNYGKEKLQVHLKQYCQANQLICPSASTIGNLIRDMGGLRKFPVKVRHNGQSVKRKKIKKERKPKDFKALFPGHCLAFDSIEKIFHNRKIYFVTCTDLFGRFSLAQATRSHASRAAKEFYELVKFLFPFEIKYVLTDNGSEFMKDFDLALKAEHKTHWHTYPKTPKMNAHEERFNRTIQEEYIDYHLAELHDLTKFNIGLLKHLLWHNTVRPHHSLNLQTPVNFISANYPHQECNMYLTNTFICNFF